MNNKKKTILITGGAGFIGSHLCDKYLSDGHKVIAVDNLQTTYTTQNIEHLFDHPNFRFIKHDIIEPIKFDEKIDWIYNFACPAQCVNLQYDPVHTLKTSVHGVINMLELAREHNARIIQASTSEIYGHDPKMPQVETDCGEVNTLGPRACYDEGKRVSETLMMDYHRQFGTDVKIVRIFNTYGPRVYIRDGRVMSNFITRALEGEDIPIYGDGSFTRSFQYVDDFIGGVDAFMSKDGFTGPVNIGNPYQVTIKELAELIIKKTGNKSKLVYKEAVTDDPIRRQPDISLAKKEFGYEPQISLDEGIERTIEYFKTAPKPDNKILVFTTTYTPDLGPAEKALDDLARSMPDTEFHVVTTKSRKKLDNFEKMDNVHIHRLGSGNVLGKYLFPLRGAMHARKLGREHKYRFAWSVMASYGALAAMFLKMMDKDINFLLTYDKSELGGRGQLKSKLFFPIQQAMFRRADQVYLSDYELEKEARFFDPDSKVEVIDEHGKAFVDSVRRTYTHLLNKQEKKLDRPL